MTRCLKCDDEITAKTRFCGKCGFLQSNKVEASEKDWSAHSPGHSLPTAVLNNLTSIRSIVVKISEQKQSIQNKKPGFWITISVLACLIGGLGAYIASTYLFNPASKSTPVAWPSRDIQPSLSLQGPLSATIKQGQVLTLHGEHFRVNAPISFLLDSTLPIKNKNNQIISAQASSRGDFDTSIPIEGSDWSASLHHIQGVDNLTKQNAYLTIVVSPASTPVTTSQNLALSIGGESVKGLIFHAVAGQENPAQQRVTLANTSGSPLHWTVTTNADNNLDWLVVDDNHLAGNLGINGTDSIGISALIRALKANSTYKGQIVFTINRQEQLLLPVDLHMADTQSEIVFNPNPVAIVGAGNTCRSTTFTLINVGNAFINWTLRPSPAAENHIRFTANGQPVTQGQLASSGVNGETQLLKLECSGVSAGDSYDFVMYAGPIQTRVTITIQASS